MGNIIQTELVIFRNIYVNKCMHVVTIKNDRNVSKSKEGHVGCFGGMKEEEEMMQLY